MLAQEFVYLQKRGLCFVVIKRADSNVRTGFTGKHYAQIVSRCRKDLRARNGMVRNASREARALAIRRHFAYEIDLKNVARRRGGLEVNRGDCPHDIAAA